MQRIKQFIISGLVALTLGFGLAPALVPGTALALDPKSEVCNSIGSSTDCSATTGLDVGNVLRAVISLLSLLVGVIAVIMIIISGLRYITSGGDSSKTASAKSTLIYSIVGLVVAVLAGVIVRYVLAKV